MSDAASDRPLLPDRRHFWLWVWSAIRPVFGWVLVALGALALFLGWYGVSGEALTAKQLPYLVSGGLTGIALVIMAGVFLATEDVRRQLGRVDDLQRKIDDLYSLFVEELAATAPDSESAATQPGISGDSAFVALPSGSSFHVPGCALVAGKSAVSPVDERAIHVRKLRPCRVCDPPAAG